MAKQLGAVEICCDAPSYEIVRGCRCVGIQSPEDVRWLRMSTYRDQHPDRARGVLSSLWELFLGSSESAGGACSCGEPLPELGLVVVTFEGGEEAVHLLGQCPCCGTVFWDVA